MWTHKTSAAKRAGASPFQSPKQVSHTRRALPNLDFNFSISCIRECRRNMSICGSADPVVSSRRIEDAANTQKSILSWRSDVFLHSHEGARHRAWRKRMQAMSHVIVRMSQIIPKTYSSKVRSALWRWLTVGWYFMTCERVKTLHTFKITGCFPVVQMSKVWP